MVAVAHLNAFGFQEGLVEASGLILLVIATASVAVVAAVAALRSRSRQDDPAAGPSEGEAAPFPGASGGLIASDRVFASVALDTRDDALSFISDNAVRLGIADDADALMAAFLKREGEGTTGMMDGFAVPHAKTDAVRRPSVMVVRDPSGIGSWNTMDQKPVTVAIALLVPQAQVGTAHIKLLSKVAEALMDEDFRACVKRESDPALIARAISERLG